jgi:tetratricopeptide (TPR) repeat protein
MTRAIELNPESGLYYAYRGDVYETEGYFELAQKDYQSVLQVDPHFLKTYYAVLRDLENKNNYLMANHVRAFINKILGIIQ